MKIITREEAMERRLKRYFRGKPCKHGHVAEQLVTSKYCVTCNRERQRKLRQDHPDQRREYDRRRYAKNADKIRARARAYQAKHRDVVLEKKSAHYFSHREEILARHKRHRDETKALARILKEAAKTDVELQHLIGELNDALS